MADKYGDGCCGHPPGNSWLKDPYREQHRSCAFQGIQQERQYTCDFSSTPRNVCGSSSAGTSFSDIAAFFRTHYEVTKWYRTKQIGNQDNKDGPQFDTDSRSKLFSGLQKIRL